MASDPHDEIAQRFRAFADAVASGDVAAFKLLCVDDVEPETELFLENSAKVRAAGYRLVLQRIDQEGEVAEVTFDLVDQHGHAVDEGVLTFTEEASGWKVRSL